MHTSTRIHTNIWIKCSQTLTFSIQYIQTCSQSNKPVKCTAAEVPQHKNCVWLSPLPSSVTSNTLPHLSIWYLFGYCLCHYYCCSVIHSPTALISILSHQLIQRNVIIVTRRLMQAMQMRNGLWRGVLQAVTYSGEFLPTLLYSTTLQKPWPITELHPSSLCSEAYVSLSACTLCMTEFIYSAVAKETEGLHGLKK